MEFTSSLGRPIQGMSNQPQKVRQEGQCTRQVNMMPSVVDGLRTRIHSMFINVLDYIPFGSYIHMYKRDDDEKYYLIVDGTDTVVVYDSLGRKCRVTGTAPYLTSGIQSPERRISAFTIGDTTFILNNEVQVVSDGIMSPDIFNQAVVESKFGAYGLTYSVTLVHEDTTYVGSYTTPNGGTPADVLNTDSEYIIGQILESFSDEAKAEYSFEQDSRFLYIHRLDGDTFDITTSDGVGGENLLSTVYNVKDISDLPARAPEDMIVKVVEEGAAKESAIYLVATKEGGKIIWKETTAPNVMTGFNEATLPHILIRDSIGEDGIAEFTLKTGDWEPRRVGDENNNPMPSFFDADKPRTLSTIGVFQNRLFVTSGEYLILSRTDNYFDFFRYTTKEAVDSDPIDIFSDNNQINILKSHQVLGGDLLLFSDNAQFLLRGDIPQTKKTAILSKINSYECLAGVKPVSTGENLYFPFSYGRYSGVREMFTSDYSNTKRASPITSHVDQLIDGDIRDMSTSTNVNTMFCVAEGNTNILYVYDWLIQDEGKVQSAWHIWELPSLTKIHAARYIDSTLYIISTDQKGTTILESIDMGDDLQNELDFHIRLDRKQLATFSYNVVSGMWESNALDYVPYELSTVEVIQVNSEHEEYNGIPIPVIYEDGIFKTDYPLSERLDSNPKCVFGELIPIEYEPTQPNIRDYKGNITSLNKPVIGTLVFNFDKVGNFSVEVEDKFGMVIEHEFNNRKIGAPNNIVGHSWSYELTETIPVRRKSEEVFFRLKSTYHTEVQLRDIEWTGQSNPRKKRI